MDPLGRRDALYRLSTMREQSRWTTAAEVWREGWSGQREHPERGRLCTRPVRKGWILQVEQVRQAIPREGKQPGQGLEVRGRAWEAGNGKDRAARSRVALLDSLGALNARLRP